MDDENPHKFDRKELKKEVMWGRAIPTPTGGRRQLVARQIDEAKPGIFLTRQISEYINSHL